MTGPIANQQAITDIVKRFGDQEHRQGLTMIERVPVRSSDFSMIGSKTVRYKMNLDHAENQAKASEKIYGELNALIARTPEHAAKIIDNFVDRRMIVMSEHLIPFTGPSDEELDAQKQAFKDALKGAYGV